MMDQGSDLLKQLHDIHQPTPLNMWSFAPGWYVVLGVFLIGLGVAILFGWRWYQHGKVKRAALRMLSEYEKEYYQTANAQKTSADLNELLKRVALAYFAREKVAQLCGKDWLLFLNQTSHNLDFLPEEAALLLCPYQKEQPRDLRALLHLVRAWIQERGAPCLS